jgi:glycine oxidase
MNDLQGLRVVVAGAGAVGSVTALAVLRCGADVMLTDSAPRGDNASGLAAGMLAPAFEALLDPVADDHFPLLAVAMDFWSALAGSLPAGWGLIERAGALYIADDEDELQRRAKRMAAFDPASEVLSPAKAAALSPGLTTRRPVLFSGFDWRLEPRTMLATLQSAFLQEGGRLGDQAVTGWSPGSAQLSSGESYRADTLILATGAAVAPFADVPELARLTPIKGQLLRFDAAAPLAGPSVRAPGVYVAPSRGGAVVGATMQVGRRDREIEPEAVAGLRAGATALYPDLDRASASAYAGIRAATPDGLPLVGFSSGPPGVLLMVGARRNGWLLAPAMADVAAARLRGVPGGAFGEAFDPARFA